MINMALREKILRWADSWTRIPVFGLDISDLSIKYLQFRPDGKGPKPDIFGEIPVPEAVIENGKIKKEDELEKILSGWLAKEWGKFRSAFAVVSLPEEEGFLRLIQIPKIKRDEVANAIRWEIEGNIPLPLNELVYDYEVVEPPDSNFDHLDVVISAFPKTVVESYLGVLRRAGLKVLAMEVESQAIVRSLLPYLTRSGEAKIIVDIGRTRTGIIIFAGGAIVYTTTVNFGGKILEENLMRNLNISMEEAVAVKNGKGLDKNAYEGGIFDALLPALSALADELKKTITFYQTHAKHTHRVDGLIDSIILIGGDGNLLGLATYLSGALKVRTVMGDFLSVLSSSPSFPIPALPRNKSLAYATAIGLGLRNVKTGNQ